MSKINHTYNLSGNSQNSGNLFLLKEIKIIRIILFPFFLLSKNKSHG